MTEPSFFPDDEPKMRTVQTSIKILQQMQGNGLQWMRSVTNREQVCQAMQYYLTCTGIDSSAFPSVIHIAGTKGKGSTASMTESMLRHAGLKTALFTSPHLTHVCERFQVSGRPVPEQTYLQHFFWLWDTLKDTAAKPVDEGTLGLRPPQADDARLSVPSAGVAASGTTMPSPSPTPLASIPPLPGFNFLTILAMRMFTEANVDVVVLETGLGGRLDATNIFEAPTVACTGITTLDFDHVETLGDTLPQIASEKAGIFKPGVPAVTVPQRADALARLCEVAAERGTPLFTCDSALLASRTSDGQPPQLGIGGRFQQTNAALAVSLVDLFMHQRQSGRLPRLSPTIADAQPAGVAGAAAMPTRQRSSSFDDSFGASVKPTIGRVQVPPLLYDVRSPLAPWAVEGLRRTSWPGRAQTLLVDAVTGKAVADGQAQQANSVVRLYLDGAHTGLSMSEAVAWFAGQTRGAGSLISSSASAPQPARDDTDGRKALKVLIFTCGQDKDVMSLLLALSTVSWDLVLLAGVEWTLTRRVTCLTPATALESFIKRRRAMGDERTLADIEEGLRSAGAQAASASSHDSSQEDNPEAATPVPLAWQYTLATLLSNVYTAPEYSSVRQRMAPVGVGDAATVLDDKQQAATSPSSPEAVAMPTRPPPIRVVSSFDEALGLVRGIANGDKAAVHGLELPVQSGQPTPVDVLVTGSLYLVGAALTSTQA